MTEPTKPTGGWPTWAKVLVALAVLYGFSQFLASTADPNVPEYCTTTDYQTGVC